MCPPSLLWILERLLGNTLISREYSHKRDCRKLICWRHRNTGDQDAILQSKNARSYPTTETSKCVHQQTWTKKYPNRDDSFSRVRFDRSLYPRWRQRQGPYLTVTGLVCCLRLKSTSLEACQCIHDFGVTSFCRHCHSSVPTCRDHQGTDRWRFRTYFLREQHYIDSSHRDLLFLCRAVGGVWCMCNSIRTHI